MKVFISHAVDYDGHRILGVFSSEENAYVIGNSLRPTMNPDAPVGTVADTSVFLLDGMYVTEHEVL